MSDTRRDESFALETTDQLAFLTCTPIRQSEAIVHAFSTRLGGVSGLPYASLNLSVGSGDDPRHVQENRRRFGHAIGFDAADLVALRQVHGNRVAILAAGRDPRIVRGTPGDALITDRPQLPLAVITADCFPVILVAPRLPAVGIIHSGRQGTAAQVVPTAIELMCQEFRVQPDTMVGAVGPGIGGCCYEVDAASAEPFITQYSDEDAVYRPSRQGHVYLDLQRAILQQLEAVGVPSSQVWSADLCTACHPQWFYSYRREGPRSGRMLNVVMIQSTARDASR
jgi:YfiH family protein